MGVVAMEAPVRLRRHVVTLADGHRVGIATGGHGVPLVLVHGFGAESLLYAQPLARLAASGFRVIAIDMPGHGRTAPLAGSSTAKRTRELVAAFVPLIILVTDVKLPPT